MGGMAMGYGWYGWYGWFGWYGWYGARVVQVGGLCPFPSIPQGVMMWARYLSHWHSSSDAAEAGAQAEAAVALAVAEISGLTPPITSQSTPGH